MNPLILGFSILFSITYAKDLQLEILPKQYLNHGAACLDGSPPAIYINKTKHQPSINKWVIYIKGGGWCVNNTQCLGRATESLLGSSSNLQVQQPTFGYGSSGPIGNDPAKNRFATFNRVMLWYCDGGSFSGNNNDPVPVIDPKTNATKHIFYRGKRNLDAMLMYLRQRHNLNAATHVLLSGGSAGALAAYLHADYVHSTFSTSTSLIKFKVAPVSGFFLNHATMQHTNIFPSHSRHVFHMMNSTQGVNQQCIAAMKNSSPPKDPSNCFFANYSYAYINSSIFVLNSAVDAYQMKDIFQIPSKCGK